MTSQDVPQEALHRQIAVECNNAAWDLAERDCSIGELDDLMRLALTASYHWRKVGTALQVERADQLVALAHGMLGHGATATRKAQALERALSQRADPIPDWEQAIVTMIGVYAAWAAGDGRRMAAGYATAEAQLAEIASDGDREIAQRLFRRLPRP